MLALYLYETCVLDFYKSALDSPNLRLVVEIAKTESCFKAGLTRWQQSLDWINSSCVHKERKLVRQQRKPQEQMSIHLSTTRGMWGPCGRWRLGTLFWAGVQADVTKHTRVLPKVHGKMELKIGLLWCKNVLKSMHNYFIICIFHQPSEDPLAKLWNYLPFSYFLSCSVTSGFQVCFPVREVIH